MKTDIIVFSVDQIYKHCTFILKHQDQGCPGEQNSNDSVPESQ